MLTGLIFALILGAVWGFFWGGVDAGIAKLTRELVDENQVVSVIRMIVSGYIAQSLAGFVVALVFGVHVVGLGLISLIVAALLWYRSREYFAERLG